MKRLLICSLIIVFFSGCSFMHSFFVRNFLNEPALIEVFSFAHSRLENLPAEVKTADKVVSFRPQFRNAFKSTEKLNFKSPSNFTITLKPRSTADLTSLVGRAVNSRSNEMNYIAIIRTAKRTDTLFSEYADLKRFKHKAAAFLDYPSYYDIR